MLKLENVSKAYRTDEVETRALSGVSLEIQAGEFVAIMGPSGCGKSTLLNILELLDTPTGGSYRFFGEEVAGRSEKQLTQRRRSGIGFVFQSFNLIDDLNVTENIEVSLLYQGSVARERLERVNRRRAGSRGSESSREAFAASTLRRPAAARGDRSRARRQSQADSR